MSSTISVGYHLIRNTIVLTISDRLTNEESRTLWHPRIYDTRWNNPRMMEQCQTISYSWNPHSIILRPWNLPQISSGADDHELRTRRVMKTTSDNLGIVRPTKNRTRITRPTKDHVGKSRQATESWNRGISNFEVQDYEIHVESHRNSAGTYGTNEIAIFYRYPVSTMLTFFEQTNKSPVNRFLHAKLSNKVTD